jgi:hypothetical protein
MLTFIVIVKGHEKEKDTPWNAAQQATQTHGNPAVRQTSKRSHNVEHNGHNVVKKISTRIADWASSLIARLGGRWKNVRNDR